MAKEVEAKIKLTGSVDGSLTSALNAAQQTMNSLKNSTSQLSSASASLGSAYASQRAKLKELQNAYSGYASAGQTASAEAQNLFNEMMNAEGTMLQLKSAMDQGKQAIQQTGQVSDEVKMEIASLNQTISEQEAQLENLQATYDGWSEAMVADEETLSELQSEIDELNSNLEENKSKLEQAQNAAREMASSHEEVISVTDQLKSSIQEQKSALDQVKQAYVEAYLKEGEMGEETQRLGNEIKNLSSSLEESQSAMSEAQRAADALDQTIDTAGDSANQAASKFDTLKIAVGNLLADMAKAGLQKSWDFVKDSVKTGMDFTASMSEVQAISKATDSQMQQLTATAREYGATTKFTASDSAQALKYMSLAGWSVQESIDGLPGVLDLAAASGMELAHASDMVTDYLSAFGMQASDAAYFADMLTTAQNESNTTAEMLGEAYKNCAANLNAAGQDVQTTTSFLEAMANQGLKGSEAGTALSAVMRDITSSMKDGAITIGETSIAVQDEAGNFLDLTEIMKGVEAATQGMGDAERAAALSKTFTADSQKAVNLALNEGMDAIEGYENSLKDCTGAAKEAAEIMQDNLAGDWAKFNSALEAVQLSIYNVVEPALRSLCQFVTNYVLPAVQGFFDFLGSIKLPDGLSDIAGPLIGSVALIAGAIGVGKLAVAGWNKIKALNPFSRTEGEVESSASGMQSAIQGLGNGIKSAFEGAGHLIESVGTAISTAAQGIGTGIQSILSGFNLMGTQGLIAFAGSVAVVTGAFLLLAACQDVVLPFLQGLADIILELSGIFPQLGEMIGNCAPLVEALGQAFEGLGQGLQFALEGVSSVIESIGSGIQSILNGIADVVRSFGDSCLNTGKGVDQFSVGMMRLSQINTGALVNNLIQIGLNLNKITDYAQDMKSFGQGFESFGNGLDSIAQSADQALNSMQNIVEMSDLVTQAFESMQGAGEKLDSVKTALSEGLGAISEVLNDKFADTVPAIQQAAGDMGDAFIEMDTAISTATQNISSQLEKIDQSIQNIANSSSGLDRLSESAEKINLFSNAIKKLANLDGETARTNIQSVSTALKDIANMASGLDTAGNGMQALGVGLRTIGESSATAADGIGRIVEVKSQFEDAITFLEGMGERLTGVTNSLSTAFTEMSNSIDQNFPTVAQSLQTVSDQMVASLETIQVAAQNASADFSAIASDIDSTFSNIVNSASQMEQVQATITSQMDVAQGNTASSLDIMNQSFSNNLSTINSTVQTNFNQIVNTIRNKMNEAVSACADGVSKMRSTLGVTIQGPKITLPHISVSTSSVGYGDGQSVSIPNFSVSYYAKGGILDAATLLGFSGTTAHIAGEAGPEAIMPIDSLWDEIDRTIEKGMSAAATLAQQRDFEYSPLGRLSDNTLGQLFSSNQTYNNTVHSTIAPVFNFGSTDQVANNSQVQGQIEDLIKKAVEEAERKILNDLEFLSKERRDRAYG